jgi:hypothetical protein
MQIHQPSITGSLTLTGSLAVIGLVENQSPGLKAVKIDTSSGAFYFGEAGSSVPSGTVSGSIQVDHDATTNYVANEHIDHTSVSITAGDGLSGGGDISSTSTLTLNTGSTHFSTGVSASAAAAGFGAGGGSGTIEGSGTTDYMPIFTNSTTLGNSPIYKSTALDATNGALGINTTDLSTSFGSVPDLRVAGVSTNDPGVLDLLRKDGTIVADESAGILQFSVDDDNMYTISQIEATSANTAGTGNSGGGNLLFKTTPYGSGTTPTERMRINSSGNIGIGTTNPGGLLHVSSGTSGDAIVVIESDTDDSDNADNPHLEFRQDGNTIRGKIGLEGTAGQTYSNSIANATYLGSVFEQPVQIITGDTGGVQTAKMTIQPNNGSSAFGYVGIGTTSPTTLLDVNGTTTTVSLVETSTRELKEDIQPLENQLEKIKQLQPVEFTWKKDKKKDFGLIAEEVEEIYPYLVEHDSDNNLIGVKYSKLTSVLIKALQEQQHQIDELKEEIIHLKTK